MKHPVHLDFLQANQAVAALESRRELLRPGAADPVVARAIADCRSAEYAIRAAFRFPSEAQMDAAHEASVAEMVELKDAEYGEAPLADWSPGELSEAYGR